MEKARQIAEQNAKAAALRNIEIQKQIAAQKLIAEQNAKAAQ